jgi:hypothetical protein
MRAGIRHAAAAPRRRPAAGNASAVVASRAVLLVASLLAVGAAAVSATAFWSGSSSGGAAGLLAAPEVTAGASSVSGLYPGSQPQPVPVTITNNGATAFTVAAVTPVVASSKKTCPAASVVVQPVTLPVTVAAGASTDLGVPASLALSAPDACQGVTFKITVQVEGTFS